MLDKINKLSLPVVIIIASIILGGSYYVTQVNKQRSIERQQQLELQQEHKEYVAKRRGECYDIYLQEKEDWNNVEGYFYREKGSGLFENDDVCVVKYENSDWEEGDPLEDKYFTDEF